MIGQASDWAPFSMRARRLVIKEVNPLGCGWFIDMFQPDIVILLRHPAAIAESYRRLGWRIAQEEDFWANMGRYVAETWAQMFDDIKHYDRCHFVRYEDLCMDPIIEFSKLYDQVGLTWDSEVTQYLLALSKGSTDKKLATHYSENTERAYSLSRQTDRMANNWRQYVSQPSLEQVLNTFQQVSLPKIAQYTV